MKRKLCKFLLIGIGIVFLIPILLTITNSFMTPTEIQMHYGEGKTGIELIPQKISIRQYYLLLVERYQYIVMLWRSIQLTIIIVIGQVTYSVFMGSYIAKINYKLRNTILFLYIIAMIMPYQVTMLSMYIEAKMLGILRTDYSIILPAVFSPIGVILISQIVNSIPNEILEAVQLESNSWWDLFRAAILPNIKGAIIVLSIFTFSEAWNMVEQPIAMFDKSNLYPLSVQLAYLSQDIDIVFAGCVIYILPVFLLYFYLEESLEENLKKIKI